MGKEFKEFIFRGNIVDMAIGIIIGAAFGNIINSLVNDIVMAAIGWAMAGVSFAQMGYPAAAPVIFYGKFIQAVVNFLVIAICIFSFMKVISRFQKKTEEAPAEKGPSTEELLADIRDLLKESKNKD